MAASLRGPLCGQSPLRQRVAFAPQRLQAVRRNADLRHSGFAQRWPARCCLQQRAASAVAAESGNQGDSTGDMRESQETARAAQKLVAVANGVGEPAAARATWEGLVLLALAAAAWACGHWQTLLAAAKRIPVTDLAACVLFAAALLRMVPGRARMGAAHLAALLQSVFLLGSVAYDIAEVKADIKQLRKYMQALSDRAAWVPPRVKRPPKAPSAPLPPQRTAGDIISKRQQQRRQQIHDA